MPPRHDKVRQDKMGQDRTRWDKTGEDGTRQDKMGKDGTRHREKVKSCRWKRGVVAGTEKE